MLLLNLQESSGMGIGMAKKVTKKFAQGDWEMGESTESLMDTMSRALSGILLNPNLDLDRDRAAKAARMFAVEVVDAFDDMMENASDDFDNDACDVVWELLLATVAPVAASASSDDFRDAGSITEMACTCTSYAKSAWLEFAEADREDGDEDEEDEDDDDLLSVIRSDSRYT